MITSNFRINRFSVSNPCLNCKDRVLYCHSNCKKYKDFKVQSEKEKSVIDSNRRNEYVSNSVRRKFITVKWKMEKNYGF